MASPALSLARSVASSASVASALLAPGSIGRAVRARWSSEEHFEAAKCVQRYLRGYVARRPLAWCRRDGAPRVARMCAPVDEAVQRHQRVGVRWLISAFHAGGGILADEPGLGKTLQAIGAVEALVRRGLATRVLVVAPANLVAVWEAELGKWLPKAHALNTSIVNKDAAALHAVEKLRDLTAVRPPAAAWTLIPSKNHL